MPSRRQEDNNWTLDSGVLVTSTNSITLCLRRMAHRRTLLRFIFVLLLAKSPVQSKLDTDEASYRKYKDIHLPKAIKVAQDCDTLPRDEVCGYVGGTFPEIENQYDNDVVKRLAEKHKVGKVLLGIVCEMQVGKGWATRGNPIDPLPWTNWKSKSDGKTDRAAQQRDCKVILMVKGKWEKTDCNTTLKDFICLGGIDHAARIEFYSLVIVGIIAAATLLCCICYCSSGFCLGNSIRKHRKMIAAMMLGEQVEDEAEQKPPQPKQKKSSASQNQQTQPDGGAELKPSTSVMAASNAPSEVSNKE